MLGLPSGSVVSETVQPYLLKRRCGVPTESGIVASVARKFFVVVSHGLFLGLSTLLAWPLLDQDSTAAIGRRGLPWLLLATSGVLVGAALGVVLATAHGRVADRVHRGLDRFGGRWLGAWLERNALRFQRTDEGLAAFFRQEPIALVPSILLYVAGWFLRAVETWLFLRLVGVDVPLPAAMVIETALILVRAMAVPVPAGLGVQDTGYVLCLKALGVPDATTVGAAFVLLKRGKDLFWILLGFLLLGVGRRRGEAALAALPGRTRPSPPGAGRSGCPRRCRRPRPSRRAAPPRAPLPSLRPAGPPARCDRLLPGLEADPELRRRVREGHEGGEGHVEPLRHSAEAQRHREGVLADREVPVLVLQDDRHLVGMARVQAGRDRDSRVRGPEGQVEVVLAREPLARRQAQRLAGHVAERLPDEPRVVERVLLGHAPLYPCLVSPRASCFTALVRLVTRPDLDGLTCAVLLSQCETIDSVELVHPQDVTDRRVSIGPADVLANLPYHPSCGMWFDNHLLTDPKAMPPTGFKGRYGKAPSAARLVYEHYLPAHPELARHATLVTETDRLDSAQLTLEDVVAPSGYILVGLTLDSRTSLGRPPRVLRPAAPRGARPAGRGGRRPARRCGSGRPACASRTTRSGRPPSPTRACTARWS